MSMLFGRLGGALARACKAVGRVLGKAARTPVFWLLSLGIGVLGAMVGQIGALEATEAIKLLAGFGEPLVGRVMVLDALRGRWSVLPLRKG